MTKKKKTKKVTINRGSPNSNMAIMGNIRQTTSPIIGETHEPVMVELDQSEDKKEKKKKKDK